MSGRKVMQIAAVPSGPGECGSLFALCDDGTVWLMNLVPGSQWVQVPPIPQGAAWQP